MIAHVKLSDALLVFGTSGWTLSWYDENRVVQVQAVDADEWNSSRELGEAILAALGTDPVEGEVRIYRGDNSSPVGSVRLRDREVVDWKGAREIRSCRPS
jgi:hypothetical protein